MKKIILPLIVAASILVVACSSHSKVDTEKFVERSKKLGVNESMHHVKFLGVKHGSAYLEIWNGLAMRKGDQYHIISTKYEDLPKDIQLKIKNETNMKIKWNNN